jgi:hypothetical protein
MGLTDQRLTELKALAALDPGPSREVTLGSPTRAPDSRSAPS